MNRSADVRQMSLYGLMLIPVPLGSCVPTFPISALTPCAPSPRISSSKSQLSNMMQNIPLEGDSISKRLSPPLLPPSSQNVHDVQYEPDGDHHHRGLVQRPDDGEVPASPPPAPQRFGN